MSASIPTQRRVASAAVALGAFLLQAAAVSQSAWAQRNIPVFRYTGAPKVEAARPGAARPPGEPLIPAPNDPSPENKALSTSGRDGWEDPAKWTSAIDMTSGCTGTLIGPQVLLTAAHCAERAPVFDFETEAPPETRLIRVTCAMHPLYRPQGYQRHFDYGLCHLAEPFLKKVLIGVKRESVPFQRLSIDPRDVRERGRLLLAGFGCWRRTSEARDGNLRAGMATIAGVSPLRITLGTPFNRQSAVLCAGDSGGPAFRLLTRDPYGPRVLVGVNSASNVFQSVSYVVPTSAPAFLQFLASWRAHWGNPKICGLDKDIETRCHPKGLLRLPDIASD